MGKKYLVTEDALNELVSDAMVAGRKRQAFCHSGMTIGIKVPPNARVLTRGQVNAALHKVWEEYYYFSDISKFHELINELFGKDTDNG